MAFGFEDLVKGGFVSIQKRPLLNFLSLCLFLLCFTRWSRPRLNKMLDYEATSIITLKR